MFVQGWLTLLSIVNVSILLAGAIGTLRYTFSDMVFAGFFLLLGVFVVFFLQLGIRDTKSLKTPYW